jgi:thiol-disulfide isomerase/thioredoxin
MRYRGAMVPWKVLLLCAVVGLVGCAGTSAPPSAQSPILDKDLPKFKRRTVNAPGSVNTQQAGQVVVVKFFAKYCEPCKKTLPEAQRLHQANADVLFIGIAEDEYQADVEEMISTYRLSFPVVHDRGNVLAGRFRVQELPITFVADDSGRIRWVGDGQTSASGLEAAIEWARQPPLP